MTVQPILVLVEELTLLVIVSLCCQLVMRLRAAEEHKRMDDLSRWEGAKLWRVKTSWDRWNMTVIIRCVAEEVNMFLHMSSACLHAQRATKPAGV